ncbi:spheroidene monooxygenase [Cnuella takakiae]|uniref:Spheroidene monooxygenase n=1 Tax=Cnuella takakiae TaxID=1302690 RepID=A0A1M5EMJ5_9BACT|nr:hypothetical protein [Cnuella takakiae]OLY91226.1 hypothetical protein BUE76_04410 [Cnuella takakiae]SHF80321.1 spheroidene monooxygenase [Cnuella takakiae]
MLTTVTLLSFSENKARAFAAMGLLPRKLKGVPGLRFFKMMGSGRGQAFSLRPDFSRYCLLAVWQSQAEAAAFFSSNTHWLQYQALAAGTVQFQLEPLSAKGSWNGIQPFDHSNAKPPQHTPVAVLTRASLHWHRLPSFWRNARTATADMPQADGLQLSLGIGEVPYIEQATFSVWENADKMMAFVTAPAHLQAIKLRHKEAWYKEELFARFTISKITCDRPELFAGVKELQALLQAA